jgi:hypothetical protein
MVVSAPGRAASGWPAERRHLRSGAMSPRPSDPIGSSTVEPTPCGGRTTRLRKAWCAQTSSPPPINVYWTKSIGPDSAPAIDGRTGAGVPMILCIPAPPLCLKNPFIRSIASEHKPSTPAIAAAINRRSIKERKLSVLRAIDEGSPCVETTAPIDRSIPARRRHCRPDSAVRVGGAPRKSTTPRR